MAITAPGTWLDAWEGPTVVQHGDYRLDNMLFDDGPNPSVIVFDWQTARQRDKRIPATALMRYVSRETLSAKLVDHSPKNR